MTPHEVYCNDFPLHEFKRNGMVLHEVKCNNGVLKLCINGMGIDLLDPILDNMTHFQLVDFRFNIVIFNQTKNSNSLQATKPRTPLPRLVLSTAKL